MDRSSNRALFTPFSSMHCDESGSVHAPTQPDWMDAETRGFLKRPDNSSGIAKIVHAVLMTAMVVATVKIAWILVLSV